MKTLIMVMMLMVPVSGLPLILNDTRQNDQIFVTPHLRDEQENSTRLEFPQINNSTDMSSWNITGNMRNNTDISPFINITSDNRRNDTDVSPFTNITSDITNNNTVSLLMNITSDNMRNETEDSMLMNITSDNMNISDVPPLMNVTDDRVVSPFMMFLPQDKPKTSVSMSVGRGCPLPTCQTANLGDALQTGDEMAGKSTSDPFGIGKK